MVFTLICAVFLIVFCVELFLINRGAETVEDPVIARDEIAELPEGLEHALADPWEDDPFGLCSDDPQPAITTAVTPTVSDASNSRRGRRIG